MKYLRRACCGGARAHAATCARRCAHVWRRSALRARESENGGGINQRKYRNNGSVDSGDAQHGGKQANGSVKISK
jgi:hypothetical protein